MGIEIKITPEMKAQFAAETLMHLELLEQMLLKLEAKSFDADTLNAAFRAVHSIKGNSDYIGVKEINALANALEDLMDDIRRQDLALTDDVVPVLFEGLDALKDMNRRITREPYQEKNIDWLIKKIKQLKNDLPSMPQELKVTRAGVDVAAVFTKTSRQHINYLTRQAGRVLAGENSTGIYDNVKRILRTFFISANYAGFSAIAEQLNLFEQKIADRKTLGKQLAGDLLKQIQAIDALILEKSNAHAVQEKSQPLEQALLTDMLDRDYRLPAQRIDELMRQVSELVIAVSALNHAAAGISDSPIPADKIINLNRAVDEVSRTARSVHVTTQTLRLVRLDSLFDRLPRIVRDLSVKFGKKIELDVIGSETEIDRKVIEHLVDPMIHLIRNAADHGIESLEERAAKNKPDCGTITVKAVQEGNRVVIDIVDDGQGIEPDAIKAAALKREPERLEELETMAPGALLNLIFTPGFTTADASSTISGRGVGLDIVKSNLKAVGGNVTLDSEKGRATRFRLHVPVSMASVEVLLVEAGSETYALPLACIVETMTISPEAVHLVNSAETIPYKEDLIAVAPLQTVLDETDKQSFRANPGNLKCPMIVIAFGGRLKGIIVERILRRESIVVKPLERHFSGIDEFSGAALMGDGSIVLLLDPHGLM